MNPLVSICLPTYNGSAFIAEALASIVAQTYRPLELVVSDSGSTDATLNILQSFFRGESAIQLTLAPVKTPGMVKNWNAACRLVTGTFIKFAFQDDLLDPTAIQKMVTVAASDPQISMVFCRRRPLIEPGAENHPVTQYAINCCSRQDWRFQNLREIQQGRDLLGSKNLLDTPLNKIGEPTCVLVRKEALDRVGPFNETMSQIVDLEMWFRLMAIGKVGYVNEELASFRLHAAQMSVAQSESQVSAQDFRILFSKIAGPSFYPLLHRRSRAAVRDFFRRHATLPPPLRTWDDVVYDGLRRTRNRVLAWMR